MSRKGALYSGMVILRRQIFPTYCRRPYLTITLRSLNAPSSLNRSGVHAHGTTAVLPVCHHTVAPGALGAIKRLVSGLEHLFGGALIDPFGNADTDRHRYTRRTGTGTPLAPLIVVLRAVFLITQLNVVSGDGLADDFQVRHALFEGLACKHQGKLLTAIAIRLTATADFRQFAGHQPQHLVADIVAVGVV